MTVFRKIILICGGISLLSALVIGYVLFVIGQGEIEKPKEILSVGNYWLGLKKKSKIEWQASNFSEIGEGLTFFIGKVESVNPEKQILVVFTADGERLKVQLKTEVISTLLFQVPVGKNYLSLHHFKEKLSDVKKGQLVFIFGRKYSLKFTGGEKDIEEEIDFLASEIVKKI